MHNLPIEFVSEVDEHTLEFYTLNVIGILIQSDISLIKLDTWIKPTILSVVSILLKLIEALRYAARSHPGSPNGETKVLTCQQWFSLNRPDT